MTIKLRGWVTLCLAMSAPTTASAWTIDWANVAQVNNMTDVAACPNGLVYVHRRVEDAQGRPSYEEILSAYAGGVADGGVTPMLSFTNARTGQLPPRLEQLSCSPGPGGALALYGYARPTSVTSPGYICLPTSIDSTSGRCDSVITSTNSGGIVMISNVTSQARGAGVSIIATAGQSVDPNFPNTQVSSLYTAGSGLSTQFFLFSNDTRVGGFRFIDQPYGALQPVTRSEFMFGAQLTAATRRGPNDHLVFAMNSSDGSGTDPVFWLAQNVNEFQNVPSLGFTAHAPDPTRRAVNALLRPFLRHLDVTVVGSQIRVFATTSSGQIWRGIVNP